MKLDDRVIALARSQRTEIEAILGARSFRHFVELAWKQVEADPFVSNWHIDLICEELQAMARREIRELVLCVPPRHSKPVHVDELVMTQRGRIRLGDVVVGDLVLTHKGRFRRVTAIHHQGVIPTVSVRTWHGRTLRAAPDHPVLTTYGWKNAGDLIPGDTVAIPVPVDLPEGAISAKEARLLGYLVGDGHCTQRSIGITCADDRQIDDFRECVEAIGFSVSVTQKPGTKAKTCNILIGRKRPKGSENPLLAWLDGHGLMGKDSYTKRVPSRVMSAGADAARNFLAGYWACDGYIANRGFVGRKDVALGADTVNRNLALDIQHLLLRLGVRSRVRTKTNKSIVSVKQPGLYLSYQVAITSMDDAARFADNVELMHSKDERLRAIRGKCGAFRQDLVGDEVVSVEVAADAECMCLTVDEDSSFTASDIAVHNSLLVSVLFPAWVWTWNPSAKFITAAYDLRLAMRDALKCRVLLESPWYRERWPSTVLRPDQNQKGYYQTTAGGHRWSCSPTSGVTGEGADHILFDDPHNVAQGESDADREGAKRFLFEALPSRLNDPRVGTKAVIQQRVHESDVAGECIRRGWRHMVLPALFEHDHPHRHPDDPRKEDGEALNPGRFPRESVDALSGAMGQYAAAGQLQQRPVPREGGLIKTHLLGKVAAAPNDVTWIRSWDLAGTEAKLQKSDPDWTVGVKIGKSRSTGGIYVTDVVRLRAGPSEVERTLRATAERDGKRVRIRVPIDPGQAGKAMHQHLVSRILAGYPCMGERETGDKVSRALPFAGQVEAGNVWLIDAPWNQDYINVLQMFPNGAHDDDVDATSGGLAALFGGTTGMLDYFASLQADHESVSNAMGEH